MSDTNTAALETDFLPKPALATQRFRFLAVARKEIFAYSIAPAFYGTALFFLLFTSIWCFFVQGFFARNVASLEAYFGMFAYAFIAVVPALTMKSWSEERRSGSFELLSTLPFSEWDLVLGKWLAAFAALAVMLVLTIPVPLCIAPLGRFDGGVIVAEYLGALLLGAEALAIGLLFSSFSRNQAGAFLASAAVILVFTLISMLAQLSGMPTWATGIVNFLSLSYHFDSFSKGLLDSRDIIFFILGTFLFLFLNTRVLLFRNWR
jgi:ABC-2 type transport system permease protein